MGQGAGGGRHSCNAFISYASPGAATRLEADAVADDVAKAAGKVSEYGR